jgi:hypothetical protein
MVQPLKKFSLKFEHDPLEPEQNGIQIFLLKCVRMLLFLLVFCFLFIYLRDLDWGTFNQLSVHWSHWWAGATLGVLARWILPCAWSQLLRQLESVFIPMTEIVNIYARAWLARYLPSKAGVVLARTLVADKYGISKSMVAFSSVIELFLQLFVSGLAGIMGLLTLPSAWEIMKGYLPYVAISVILLFILVSPPFLNFLLRRIMGKQHVPRSISLKSILQAGLWLLLFSVMYAIYSMWMMEAVGADELFRHVIFLWGVLNFSRIVGMAALFAPAGIGVREAVQIPLFTLVMSKEMALSVSLSMRVGDILIDIIFVMVSALFAGYQKRNTAHRGFSGNSPK